MVLITYHLVGFNHVSFNSLELGLLSDQKDLYLAVINMEEERLESEIELHSLTSKLVSRYAKLLETFPELANVNSDEEEEEGQALGDNSGIQGVIQRKKETLRKEEQRVNQLR